jgi:multidrug efflux pump subunit AcrB
VPFRQLGLVVAYAIGYSLVAGIIVLPSMLALWARWRHPAELGKEPASRPAEVVGS